MIGPATQTLLDIELDQVKAEFDRIHAGTIRGDQKNLDALVPIAERMLRLCRRSRGLPPELDIIGADVAWHGKSVSLTQSEIRLTRHLATRQGHACSYRELSEAQHGRPFAVGRGEDGARNALRTFVRRIRRKFLEVDPTFASIESAPGFGYVWRVVD